MDIRELLNLILSGCSFIAVVIMVYRTFKDPSEKNEKNIEVFEAQCDGKHRLVDLHIAQINESLTLLKENHINHIEKDIKHLQEGQVRILTVLDERLPKK